ncbi:MAG: hypothetical protein HY456_00020 [Parcubacteria group bacterium]|nr:hypothetical protein [Parcubacteria group bacterium]
MDAMEIFKAMGKETIFAVVPNECLFVGADFQIYKKVRRFTRGGKKEFNAVMIQKQGGQMGRAESFCGGDWAFLFNPGL